ncbi:MAG: alpha/beta fold hydrolase [Chloroflexi bacterium]|nr:alpha/beta fold hydrolase [Chloroflexota bacterium]
MPVEIVVPKWGLSMQEGTIAHWLKQEGDRVERGEPVLEIETEKMTNVVEAPASGVLARILYPVGSVVPVRQPIALIAAPGEAIPEAAAPSQPAPSAVPTAPTASAPTDGAIGPASAIGAPEPTPTVRATAAVAPGPARAAGAIRAMPAARRIAKERGVDLATVQGTGPDGVITRGDVERAPIAPPAPSFRPTERVSFFSEGHRLDGLLYTPEGLQPGERRAAVVLCVGYTYLKTMVMPDIARALTAAGYVGLVFDYRGFGDSDGLRWRLIPGEQVNDARAALTFLADRPQVDPERLAIVGISLGGSNAIAAGALDERVGAVAAIEAVGNGERWLHSLRRYWEWQAFTARLAEDRVNRVRTGRSERVDPLEIVLPDPGSRAFLESVYREFPQMACDLPLETAEALTEFRPEASIGRLAPRPVLLIHGDADCMVPTEESRAMFAQAGEPKRLEIVPGMGHFDWVTPGSPGFRRVADLLVDFLHAVLPAR